MRDIRAGEPANVLAAPAPAFFFQAAPAPAHDFFPKQLRLLVFFSSGSGSEGPKKSDSGSWLLVKFGNKQKNPHKLVR